MHLRYCFYSPVSYHFYYKLCKVLFLSVVFFPLKGSCFSLVRVVAPFVKQCRGLQLPFSSLFLYFAISSVSKRSASALGLLKCFQYVSGFLRLEVVFTTAILQVCVGGASQISTDRIRSVHHNFFFEEFINTTTITVL